MLNILGASARVGAAHAIDLMKAAADFMGPGAIEVNRYEMEIFDIVRRVSPVLNRIPRPPANGHPHRYFDQTAIATGGAVDPRNISATATSATRTERTAFIKAFSAQTNLSLFDVDVTRQQGQFAYLEAKDIEDIINGIVVYEAANLWAGNDTSMTSPTTLQWMGLLSQITLQSTIAQGASIIDGLKAQVAAMVANQTYVVRPTAIIVNPILGDYIDREAKATKIEMGSENVEAGLSVSTLATQAGKLPIIPDPFMPIATAASYGFSAPPAGYKLYFAAILMERECEIPFIHGGDENPNPRLFQLGLLGGLQGQYVGIHFAGLLAKGASYAHAVIGVYRP